MILDCWQVSLSAVFYQGIVIGIIGIIGISLALPLYD